MMFLLVLSLNVFERNDENTRTVLYKRKENILLDFSAFKILFAAAHECIMIEIILNGADQPA